MEEVQASFKAVAEQTSTSTFRSDLNDWITTFDKAIPFLVRNDETGFIELLSEEEQLQFLDANIAITQQCRW